MTTKTMAEWQQLADEMARPATPRKNTYAVYYTVVSDNKYMPIPKVGDIVDKWIDGDLRRIKIGKIRRIDCDSAGIGSSELIAYGNYVSAE